MSRPRLMETSVVQKWAVDLGCTLFIIGSALLAAISGLDLVEDMLTCGASVFVICHKGVADFVHKKRGKDSENSPRSEAPKPQDLKSRIRSWAMKLADLFPFWRWT